MHVYLMRRHCARWILLPANTSQLIAEVVKLMEVLNFCVNFYTLAVLNYILIILVCSSVVRWFFIPTQFRHIILIDNFAPN